MSLGYHVRQFVTLVSLKIPSGFQLQQSPLIRKSTTVLVRTNLLWHIITLPVLYIHAYMYILCTQETF